MNYRPYGNTDVLVSEIGIGGHREGKDTRGGLKTTARFFRTDEERAETVAAAISSGITYFDTTYGCELESLGTSLALLGKREGLFISGMRVDFFQNFLRYGKNLFGNDIRRYTREEIDARLSEGKLEWLDQFMLGAMEQGAPVSHKTAMEDAIYELIRNVEKGKIRFFGFSCHSPDYAAEIMETFPAFNAVMTPYNYANRTAEENLARVVEQQHAAWIAMKTLVWEEYGIPVTSLNNLNPTSMTPPFDPEAPIAEYAHRWVLQNNLITTTVPAMNSISEVEENIRASEYGSLESEEDDILAQYKDLAKWKDSIGLAISGLFSNNLRIRGHSVGTLKSKLGYDVPEIDFEADDAEEQAVAASHAIVNDLRGDDEWADFMANAVGEKVPLD